MLASRVTARKDCSLQMRSCVLCCKLDDLSKQEGLSNWEVVDKELTWQSRMEKESSWLEVNIAKAQPAAQIRCKLLASLPVLWEPIWLHQTYKTSIAGIGTYCKVNL